MCNILYKLIATNKVFHHFPCWFILTIFTRTCIQGRVTPPPAPQHLCHQFLSISYWSNSECWSQTRKEVKNTRKMIDTKPLVSYLAIRLSPYYQEHLLTLLGKNRDSRDSNYSIMFFWNGKEKAIKQGGWRNNFSLYYSGFKVCFQQTKKVRNQCCDVFNVVKYRCIL